MAGKMAQEQMLEQVNTAIYTICVGGQSYKIGSRQLTRANLSELYSIKNDLEAAIAQATAGSLIDNTYVAYFEGR